MHDPVRSHGGADGADRSWRPPGAAGGSAGSGEGSRTKSGEPARRRPLSRAEHRAALETYHALDGAAERRWEDILEIAARSCDAPLAFLTFTSDEADTPVARISRSEVPELDGESAWPDTVSHPGPRVIPDLRADPEFRAHPRVSEEDGVRFYAGVPIRSPNGDALGTLSVVDIRPRTLEPSAVEALESLARLVTREMKLRESADLLADVLTRTRILSDVIPVCGDCGRVRRDEDYWEQLEVYLARETGTLLSHGVCPCCTREHYAFLDDED